MNINNIGGYYPYGDYSHNNSAYSGISGNSSYGVINSSYTNGAYNDFGNSTYESIIKSKFGYKNKQVTYTSGDITIGVGKVSNTYNNFSNIFKPKTEDGWGFTINWNF